MLQIILLLILQTLILQTPGPKGVLIYPFYGSPNGLFVDPLILTLEIALPFLSSSDSPAHPSYSMQNHLLELERWFKKWGIKINVDRSHKIKFILRNQTCPPVFIFDQPVPQAN